jgi:O-antigen/teichoic acid export membrane protein
MILNILRTKARSFFNTGLQVLIVIYINAWSENNAFGLVSTILSFAVICSIVASFGIAQANVFFHPKRTLPRFLHGAGLFTWGLSIIFLTSLISLIFFVLVYENILGFVSMPTIFLLIFLQSFLSFQLLLMQADNRINEINLANILLIIVYGCCLITISFCATLSANLIIYCYMFGLLVSVGFLSWVGFFYSKPYGSFEDLDCKIFFNYGIKSIFNNFSVNFLYRFPILLGAVYLSPRELTLLSLIIIISEKIWLISNSISLVYMPIAVRTFGKYSQFELYKRCLLYNALGVAPVFLGILIFVSLLRDYFDISVFSEINWAFLIVGLIGSTIWGFVKIQGVFTASRNLQLGVFYILVATAISVVLLTLFLEIYFLSLLILYVISALVVLISIQFFIIRPVYFFSSSD